MLVLVLMVVVVGICRRSDSSSSRRNSNLVLITELGKSECWCHVGTMTEKTQIQITAITGTGTVDNVCRLKERVL